MLLTEIKMNIVNAMSDQLNNFGHLVYVNHFQDFSFMSARPHITQLIAPDRHAVLGDFNIYKQPNFSVAAKIETDHSDAILCVCNITDDSIATGS